MASPLSRRSTGSATRVSSRPPSHIGSCSQAPTRGLWRAPASDGSRPAEPPARLSGGGQLIPASRSLRRGLVAANLVVVAGNDQPSLVGDDHRLGAIAQVEFRED